MNAKFVPFFVVGTITFVLGVVFGALTQNRNWKQDCVDHDAAHWVVTDSGIVVWRWNNLVCIDPEKDDK